MEISTIDCFSCKTALQLTDKTYFCFNCATQVRCKSCGQQLLENAKLCVTCGTPTAAHSNTVEPLNRIEFEQKGDSKKFVANFTNQIGEGLVQSLGGLFTPNAQKNQNNPFSNLKTIPPLKSGKKDNIEDATVVTELDESGYSQVLQLVFKYEDDKFKVVNQRLKQTGKKDHAIRLALLVLYAYSKVNQPQVKRAVINDILQHAKVYDANFKTWIANCDEITKIDASTLELSLPGITAAEAILQEIMDPNVDKGVVVFSKLSARSKGKRTAKNAENGNESSDGIKKGSGSSKKTPAKIVDELVAEGYFTSKRGIGEVSKYLDEKKALPINLSSLATVLARLTRNKMLNREKNKDGQYEYFA